MIMAWCGVLVDHFWGYCHENETQEKEFHEWYMGVRSRLMPSLMQIKDGPEVWVFYGTFKQLKSGTFHMSRKKYNSTFVLNFRKKRRRYNSPTTPINQQFMDIISERMLIEKLKKS